MLSSSRQEQFLVLMQSFTSGDLAAVPFCAQFAALWTQDRDSADAKKAAWPQPYDELLLAAWQAGKIGESEFQKKWAALWGYAEETKFQDMIDEIHSACYVFDLSPELQWEINEEQLRHAVSASFIEYESLGKPAVRAV